MMASGIHPLTLEHFNPIRVVLMDLENSEEQIKTEIAKICDRAGIDCPDETLMIASWPTGLELNRNDYESLVRSVLSEYQPDVVIGGPLYKMTEASLSDENASRGVSAALDRLREALGVCLILEAHQVNESVAWDQSQKKWSRNRPMRPFGSSLWRRWPEYGICLFTDGTLHRWRGDRQAREWPEKLNRDGEVWLWEPGSGNCAACGEPKPESKLLYCSETCRTRAKMRRYRAKGQQPLQE